ncbi:hypothetical protein AX769_19630 [Frondihabitans sp. PAMC 28766]|uniref:hypothetical protein n=1 Tax=Frondihabitans sp. PAMC 28766 TaxID=1795630 RepID=UPI00078B9668|nr:hypothetical protein [Frondihabitans sp. PAMC 28766]AMM21948.1 hypothetical protein AX769_19630 [Frondihabitans sp. PAMC 28766]
MVAHLRLAERPIGTLGPIASESDVHFFCVGRDRWSIYDRRLDPAVPDAFLGRLQRIAGVYEIGFADASRPRVYCASLAAARTEFVEVRVGRRAALRIVD